jgi:xanthine/CO dehydrogenase XdhC/CoxF family maturation factor
MSGSFRSLLPLFVRERAAGRALVLATVTRTEGPTYTKAGALMLIADSGEYAGLLSGGCLEGDLAEHGRCVLATGCSQLVRYDMHGPEDLLFGLGSGCEGSMEILLQRLDPAEDWQPMTRLASAWQARRSEELVLVVKSQHRALLPGSGLFTRDGVAFGPSAAAVSGSASLLIPGVEVLRFSIAPAPRVLLLGAGADALPVAQMAAFLGWHLTVIDHRPHYARAERFPSAELVLEGGPAALSELLADPARSASVAAAIVMSHHFLSDRGYLAALAGSDIPYVGLLGPVTRRERLLAQIGPSAARLRTRLCSPIGLDLGADSPEAIALAIAAELQGHLRGRQLIEPMSLRPEERSRICSLPDTVQS